MGNVVLLDDLTINKIAAGEVIERPANVVKELVENSIDAGSTNIVIEIKNGGKTYIKITDNGSGIMESDMIISLERHATSKLKQIEDLENSYTMGFRGEALASIVSISKLTMITRTQDSTIGKKIIGQAGEITEITDCACNIGTTMIVEDLFFNTPVRYKFLKQDATEFRYIKELIQKIALANPQIAIKLINDGKTVFQTNGNGNIKDIIYTLYGKEIQENLIDVNYEDTNIKINGVIGNTNIAKETRKAQIFFLNKRNIKNPILTSSADQAFKGATGINKFGFLILNIEMPANQYDINVHPTKMDVRFENEQQVYRAVYHAIKNTLLNSDFLGNSENEQIKSGYIQNEFNFLTNHFKKDLNKNENIIIDDPEVNTIENATIIENNPELINREKQRDIKYKYLGILLRTYIVVEIGEELFLIDQHAAHERLLYEQIKNNYKKNQKNNSQMMLVPELINLSHKEISFIQENIELFENTGFDLQIFGENSLKINGIPDIDYKSNSKNLLLDILDEMLTNERSSLKDIEERFIATVACKAAVKANMDLAEKEVHYLINSLLKLNNPYTCPHGRPTTVRISKNFINTELKNNS